MHTQALDPRPRYPPGYPGQPNDYLVRNSHIRIHCWRFEPDARQNATYLDNLFARLDRKYSDLRYSSIHVWSEDGEYHWTEGDERIGESNLSLYLPRALERPDFNMTYGEFSNILIGLDQLRHDYPMLSIYTEIFREGYSRDIGLTSLYTLPPDDPEEPEMRRRNL